MERAQSLIDSMADEGITARLLGGLAIAVRCPSARPPSPLARDYSDFDIVVDRHGGRELPDALSRLGFEGAERFNALNGLERQLYMSPEGIELDVFVEEFKMCHEVNLKSRLEVDERTLPLADLILTKLQVGRLTEKDVRDFAAIVLDHELSEDDRGVSVARIAEVTGGDWGWWRTITENLERVVGHVGELGLASESGSRVVRMARALHERIDEAPKSLRWKARARIGDRVAWRKEPDEKH